MNSILDYIYLAEYIAPGIVALSCAVLLAMSYGNSYTHTETHIKRIAMLYMSSSFFAWLFVTMYVFFPEAFVYIQSFGYLVLLWAQVFFYRLFHILTSLKDKERFSPWHYIVPAIVCVTLGVWSLFVPLDVQLDITLGRSKVIPEGYEAYARLFLSKMPARLLYCVFYITMTLVRLAKYYKRINISSSLVRRPAQWILLLVSLMITSIVVTTVAVFLRSAALYFSLIMMTATAAAIAEHIVLTFTILQRGYILYIISPMEALPKTRAGLPAATFVAAEEKESGKNRKPYSRESGSLLTRSSFDAWLRKHKPYLAPSFKMTDLAEAMKVNRSYLSGFVNRTYGVNFSRYVNRLRMEELDRLTGLTANKNKPIRELIKAAGFADMEHYRRALAVEEAGKTENKNE